MMDYYDYHPTVYLQRPVAIAGFYGAAADGVGQMLTQRTGLPLVELDRWIEHQAGRTIGELAMHQGEGALRALEKALLPKALAEVPPPIVVLGEGAMLDAASVRLLEQRADLVYLSGDAWTLARRATEERSLHLERVWQFLGLVEIRPQDVERMLKERRPSWERAGKIIDVNDRSCTSMATEVLDWLVSERGARGPAQHFQAQP